MMNQKSSKSVVPPVLRDVGKLAAGVASVNTSLQTKAINSSGSATGNPRNKCALKPGHSLMDWIRLGSSGRDLTGVGSKAGRLSITPKELEQHNKETDAWLAIRGKVYNVTAYLPFHPGGPDELMKGVGKDATRLFDDIHPWVNYEQILQKCCIGRLNLIDPDVDTQALFFGKNDSKVENQRINTPNKEIQATTTTTTTTTTTSAASTVRTITTTPEPPLLPRFDWIQKLDFITVIFYTAAFSNPFIEINQTITSDSTIHIHLIYDNNQFDNELKFYQNIQWPCRIRIAYETGKIELIFKKITSNIWPNYGVLKQTNKPLNSLNINQVKLKCLITNRTTINYNTCLLEMERIDRYKTVIPLGKHIKVYEEIEGKELCRSYTPVPNSLFTKYQIQQHATDNICLMVKCYQNGNVSKALYNHQIGDIITVSKPIGVFNLEKIEKRETFILLAAGTGITPMLSIILFLLERRIRKCQFLRLLFFNRTIKDILLNHHLEQLQRIDNRFIVDHILSEPDEKWNGLKGHITRTMIECIIDKHLKDSSYNRNDLYLMVCGPQIFTTLTQQILNDIGIENNQVHIFLG